MNNVTTFYLVRHGETDWNKRKLAQGHTDIPLNSYGVEQAKKLAQNLKNIKFDLVFSSDLMRAKRTSEIIALEHKLEVKSIEILRERKLGLFEGQSNEGFKEFDELFKKLSNEEKFIYKHAEDMESDEEVTTRILTFLRETAIAYPRKTILVVTHSGIMRSVLIHLGFFSYANYKHNLITNTAYLKLDSDGVDFFIKETFGIKNIK